MGDRVIGLPGDRGSQECARLFLRVSGISAMTPGEALFYIREITAVWRISHLSEETLTELERRQWIERSGEEARSIRLTKEGARQKAAFGNRKTSSTLKLFNPVQRRPWKKRR